VAGTIIGIMMARSRWVHWLVDPFVSLAFPAPKIAFIPVFILWFGIDHLSKVLLVSFACVFPIVIAMYHGAKEVNRTILWSALAMGTSQTRLLRRVMLPACLPHLFAAIRIAVPVALITTFTAEMVSGGGGVGDDLMYAQRLFDTASVFVYIIVMLATGLAFDTAILRLRKRLLRWHGEEGGRR
jgi:ABC-type nitrate/sulfonate/bicarbonate transport system permease component